MSTTVWWVLSFFWLANDNVHNMLTLADSGGTRYANEQDCAMAAASVAAHLRLSPGAWKYQCHEMDVVFDTSTNYVVIKFPEM